MGIRRVFIIVTLVIGLSSIVFLVMLVTALRRLAGEPLKTTREFFLMLSYFHISVIYVLVTCQFMFATFAIRSRFIILNKNMEYYFLMSPNELCLAGNEMRHRLVQKFASMHDKANDAIDFVNSTFSMEVRRVMVVVDCGWLSKGFNSHETTFHFSHDPHFPI